MKYRVRFDHREKERQKEAGKIGQREREREEEGEKYWRFKSDDSKTIRVLIFLLAFHFPSDQLEFSS